MSIPWIGGSKTWLYADSVVEAENESEYARLKVVLSFEHRFAFENSMSKDMAIVTSPKALRLWGTLDSLCLLLFFVLRPGDLLRFEKVYQSD